MVNYWRSGIFKGVFLLIMTACFIGNADQLPEKRVLIVYSFTINFAPDFQFITEFTRSVSNSGFNLRVKHLELDAFGPENSSDAHLAARLAPYLPDIREGKFDVLIPIGQIAINLLHRHAKDIPPQTAIAFCGLDIVTRDLVAAHPNTTGALGRVSVADNIELGLHFFPHIKRVILLTDWSIQGKRILDAGKHYEESYPGIEYIYLDNAGTDLNDMLAKVQKYDKNTLVLFYAWFNNDSTNLSSLQYIMSHLERGKAPVFAMQEPMLWPGAIGGVFTPVASIGQALAERVKQIMTGVKASDITMAAIPLSTSVNWQAVRQGRVASGKIPANAVIVGKTEFIRNEDLPKLAAAAAILLVLVILSTLVTILHFRLRSLTRRTQAILAHIPGKIVVSDIERNLLFIHSGSFLCDNSNSKLKLDALPDFSRNKIAEALLRVFNSGKTEKFECNFDNRRHCIELVKIAPAVFGIDAVLWGMNDVEELYRIRQQLDEELSKSRLTLDSVGDAVIVCDERGRVGYLNPAARQLLGNGDDIQSGRLLDEYFALIPEKRDRDKKDFLPLKAVLQEETIMQQENCLLNLPSGMVKNVIFSLAPINRDGNKPCGSVLTIRDVSRLKEYQEKLIVAAEKARNADRVKSAFLATMSHELRTPLNAVIGFSEILQHGQLTLQEQNEYLNSIYTAGKALLSLINDVLDLSKIDAGQLIILPRPTDLRKLIWELNILFMPEMKDKGIFFRVECPDDLPLLQLDDMRMRQILLNLLGNAIKFTSKGGIALKVEYMTDNHSGKVDLAIHVIDTGIGVKPEAQKSIFDPFVQQNADRDSHLFKGTGLGLAIASRLAEQMGGCLALQSEEGKGSDFTLRLHQIARAEAICEDNTPPPDASSPAVNGKLNVLLVDDVAMNLKVLQTMLKKMNIDSVCASTGAEALEILQNHPHFSLVLTDLWMPEMCGAELAQKIHAAPAHAKLPVIAVTADSQIPEEKAREFQGILLKPITLGGIQHLLQHIRITDKTTKS